MQLLQLFLANGESIGIASLTTPMLDPPRIESPKITKPKIFFPKSNIFIMFFLVIGSIKVKPTNPRTNPTHRFWLCCFALQAITTNYVMNNIAVTYSFGPDCKAWAKQSSHDRLNTAETRPIPNLKRLKSSTSHQNRKIAKNIKLIIA